MLFDNLIPINETMIEVSTEEELQEAIKSDTSIIVRNDITITNKLSFKDLHNVHIKGGKDITLNVSKGATMKFKGCDHIIVEDLAYKGIKHPDKNGEILLQFVDSNDCMVRRCSFYDGEDEQLCIKGDSDRLFIVCCRFTHSTTAYHAYSVLIGKNRNDKPQSGQYHVTFYQCYFNGGSGRNPRCRNAVIHLINCYYGHKISCYLIGPENSDLYINGCYKENTRFATNIMHFGKYRLRYENTNFWDEKSRRLPKQCDEIAVPDYEILPYNELPDVIDRLTTPE